MNIIETIDHLDTLITNAAPLHQTKPLLTNLREQAEALESRVSTLEAEPKNFDQTPLIVSLRKDLEDAKRQIRQFRDAPPDEPPETGLAGKW